MTVVSSREQFVAFTYPFFTFSISALVRRSLAQSKYGTLNKLVERSNISIGTYVGSSTLLSMSRMRQNIVPIRKLYERIMLDESNLIASADQSLALHKIHNEPFAFIQEEPRNAFLASQDCSLMTLTLYDHKSYFFGKYGEQYPSS